jgi:flagellar biosynthesis/type III secretory pathway protein FliH
MSNLKFLSIEDVNFFKSSYKEIYKQSIVLKIEESKRKEYVKKVLENVFERSIQGAEEEGYSFSTKELNSMKKEFDSIISNLENAVNEDLISN